MSDSIDTKLTFKDGDIVWMKWNNVYWPGHFRDVDNVRKKVEVAPKFIAAVEFFNENQFDFLTIKALKFVQPYDCPKKNEFIMKGLTKQRNMLDGSYMDKFLEDIKYAESLTDGNEDILLSPEFAKKEKVVKNYIGLPDRKRNKNETTPKPEDKKTVVPPKKKQKTDSQGLDSSGSFSWTSPDLAQSFPSSGSAAQDEAADVSEEETDFNTSTMTATDSVLDSDSDYDSDALNTSNTLRDCHFNVDDIVWVPHRKARYLAFVTRVEPKQRKLSLRWVNSSRDERSFVKKTKGILDFRDVERNKRFLAETVACDPNAKKTYERCIQFLASRCNPAKTLCAFRFLTHHPQDLNYGALPDKILDQYLDKATPTKDTEANEEIGDEEDEENTDESDEENNTLASPKPISGGLPNVIFTPEQRAWLSTEAEKLLQAMRGDECRAHLTAIQLGEKKSSRHDIFTAGSCNQQLALGNSGGFGPFYNTDQAMTLLTLLDRQLSKERIYHRRKYVYNVLLPEAMLFSMQKIYEITAAEAEERYNMTSTPPALAEHFKTIGISGDKGDDEVGNGMTPKDDDNEEGNSALVKPAVKEDIELKLDSVDVDAGTEEGILTRKDMTQVEVVGEALDKGNSAQTEMTQVDNVDDDQKALLIKEGIQVDHLKVDVDTLDSGKKEMTQVDSAVVDNGQLVTDSAEKEKTQVDSVNVDHGQLDSAKNETTQAETNHEALGRDDLTQVTQVEVDHKALDSCSLTLVATTQVDTVD